MHKHAKLFGLLLILALVILHGMIADHSVEAWHSFEEFGWGASANWHLIGVIAVSSALFVGATILLWRLRTLVLHSTADVVQSAEAGPADGTIILLLSLKSFGRETTHEAAIAEFTKIKRVGADPHEWFKVLTRVTFPYPRDDPSPFALWNWQQPLRLIADEMKRSSATAPINEIIVVGTGTSKDHAGVATKGSANDFDIFKSMLEALFAGWPNGGVPNIRQSSGHLQIGNYEHSYMVCKQAIDLAKSNPKNNGRTICFDITGGITESSVAAAIATLNRDVRFSYVNTNDHKPLYYDASVTVLPGGE